MSLRSSEVVHFSFTLSSIFLSCYSRSSPSSLSASLLFLSSSSTSRTSTGVSGRGFRFSGPPHQVWQQRLTCQSIIRWYWSDGMAQMSLRKSLASLRKSQGPSGLIGVYLSLLWWTSISVNLRWSIMLILERAKLKRWSWLLRKHSMQCCYILVVQLMQKQWASSSLMRSSFRQCLTMPLKISLLRSTVLVAFSETSLLQNLKCPRSCQLACESMSMHSWLWGDCIFQCFSCWFEWRMCSLLAQVSSAFRDSVSSMSIKLQSAVDFPMLNCTSCMQMNDELDGWCGISVWLNVMLAIGRYNELTMLSNKCLRGSNKNQFSQKWPAFSMFSESSL